MEDTLSYQRFCEWVNSFQFRNEKEYYKFENMVEKIGQYIPIDELEYFYPQFLFVENKDTELIFIAKHKLFLVTGTDKKLFIAVFDLKDLTEYNLEIINENGFENVVLNVYFTRERHLKLNNVTDTNLHWQRTYALKINEIYNNLLGIH